MPRILPIPGAIDPEREWEVREWRPGSGIAPHVYRGPEGNRIATPFDPSEASRAIRQHELAHVKWTPPGPMMTEGCQPETINAAEDCRIHKRLKELGFDRPRILSDADVDGWRRRLTGGPELDAARLLTAALNTGDEDPVRYMLDGIGFGHVLPIVDGVYDRLMRPRRPAWKRTPEMARELETLFAPPPELDPDDVLPGGFVAGDDAGLDLICRGYPTEGDGPGWMEMEVTQPPRPVPLPRAMREARRNRPTDTGAVPRYWDRLATDGRVFARRYRSRGGGTVLIDQSGSMSLTSDDVLALMLAVPGVVIAAYCGDGTRGELRVLARGGMRVRDDDVYIPMGGNGCDGPALRWLADQPGPRYWICDGIVTGNGDQPHRVLFRECAELCRANRIARVTTPDALIGALRDAGALPEGVTL